MSFNITDGTGTGNRARVDKTNRLVVRSTERLARDFANDKGYAFNLNTGTISLTGSSSQSAVAYFKNNELYNFEITAVILYIGNSTGGTGDLSWSFVRNPTGGTIISNASAGAIKENLNFGSTALIADTLFYKGAQGNTLTGGTSVVTGVETGTGKKIITAPLVMSRGTSLGVNITTQASNTATNVQVVIAGYLQHPDVTGT